MKRRWTPIAELNANMPMSTLREWCDSGKIFAKKIKNEWHVDLADMLERNGFDLLAEELRRAKTTRVEE